MTEDYTMLAMRSFWRYLKGIVVTMHLDLYLTVLVALSISMMCSLVVDVSTNTSPLSLSMVLSNSMSMSTSCIIMPLLQYIGITCFKYLLNCLSVWVGMGLTIKTFIPRDILISNSAPFTNTTSDMRVTNLCSLIK